MRSSLSDQISNSPLLWISAAVLIGIALASLALLQTLVWFGLAFLSLIAALLLRRVRLETTFVILLLPGFLFLGAVRYQMTQPDITPAFISYYNDIERRVYVTGTLAEPPDVRDTYLNLRLKVEKIDLGQGDLPVRGEMLIRLANEYSLAYGDRVRVRGFIQTPPENEEFSYRDYLAMQGIHSTLRTTNLTTIPGNGANPFLALIYRIKESLLQRIYQLFPEPEASLLSGILLGADKNIPTGVQQAFNNTGTTHIIAISGFNIAILAAIFVTLFSRFFGKNSGAVLAILSIILYTILVGASASVMRAAIMGTLSIIAVQFGRRTLALTTLATSALVMTLFNPFLLWDVSFQLSFAATLGLVLYAAPMQEAVSAFLARYFQSFNGEKIVAGFTEYFLLTFAAQLTTLPIIIYHFGRISLVSFFANPVVLPAQPPAMVLGGLAVLFSHLYMPLGQVVAWVAWPFASYTIRMVEFFARFQGGVLTLGEFSLLAAILFYAILFGLTFAWSRVKGIFTPAVIFSLLAVFTFLTWRSVLNSPDGRLHVTFLNAGSADGVLIKTPSGRFILINGGESPSLLADQLGRRIPPFSRGIDYLIIASTQENQVASLPRVLEQYPPRSVLWAGNHQTSFSSKRLRNWLTTNNISIENAKTNTSFDLGDGAKLRVLAVSPRGAILSVEMGKFKAVLPVGVTFEVLSELNYGQGLGPVTALLLSESGYKPSNPPEWLANIKPQLAILSVAADDSNGMPSPELLSTFENKNLLRTDINGWIDLASDGQEVWVTTEK